MKLKLIDDARSAWKWASVQLAVLAGAVSAWAATDVNGFKTVVDLLPEWARPLIGLAIAGVAISTRIVTKAKTSGDC